MQTGTQPPSGGCVLKPFIFAFEQVLCFPAAFGRLCVETVNSFLGNIETMPAAFGRLCVETGKY